MKRKIAYRIVAAVLAVMMLAGDATLAVQAGNYYPGYRNSYDKLAVPTQIEKVGDTYYLVDSYHNQVLFSKGAGVSAKDWSVMATDLAQPHAIASDGIVYMVVDTENHRVVTYAKMDEGYQELQAIGGVGVRPHYIEYDVTTGRFYVWSSMTGEMYIFRRKVNSLEVVLEKIQRVPELYGKYVRSFTIEGNMIHFPCVHASMIVTVNKNNFRVIARNPVPLSMAGMVQVTRIQNYYYLTVSTDINFDQNAATIVRARSLADFGKGNYENINKLFGGDGAPYYIEAFDGSYYATVLRVNGKPCVYKFDVQNDTLTNIQEMCR